MERRRRWLLTSFTLTATAGGIGSLIPFVSSMRPSARALAAAGPVQIDLRKVEAGTQVTVAWRGMPVWVLHRTKKMLENLSRPDLIERLNDPDSTLADQQPPYARNLGRSLKPEHFVAVGICTHLGCVPTFRPDVAPQDLGPKWRGGYFCPCHGSRFDLAGRVFKNVPAPRNLLVPPYHYLSDTTLVVGVDLPRK
jgi:ubiquinol-cytochrome c reductase iron-sulfur subunit